MNFSALRWTSMVLPSMFLRSCNLVMPIAYAVYCVNKLLKPVFSYMHSLSILFSIYFDDIRIMSDDFHLCVEYTAFCVNVLTCAGWNVNMSKSTMDPTQQLLYLGMYVHRLC